MKRFLQENKIAFIRILISACLLLIGYLTYEHVKTLSVVVFVLAYASVGYEVIIGAFKDLIKEKVIAEKMLMTVASLGALLIQEFLEATLIIVLYMIGEMVEDVGRDLSRKSLNQLASLHLDKARLKGGEIVSSESVSVGDIIEIFAGERIPLDGEVIDSEGSVDTSVMTGESLPVSVKPGNEVLAGYINTTNAIYVKVTRPLKQSAAQRIIEMSETALDKKTKSEKFIRKFAKIYTPVVICLALIIALAPPFFEFLIPTVVGVRGMHFWAYKALSMLAVSCPCAFIISVPLSYFCGIGYAAKKGILIKSSAVMNTLRNVEITAFDKTGTLTKSELHVTKVETTGDYNKIDLLKIVAVAELKSKHPVATAVLREARKFNLEIPEGAGYKEYAGDGVECDSEFGHIMAGNKNFTDAPADATGTVFVSLDGAFIGSIGIGDELKGNSKIAFEKLRKLGVKKKIILSGDKKSKVDAVAKTLLAETAYSNLKPEDKLTALDDIEESNPLMTVAYCGDGINDIPSLARADVGIAMGAVGSDGAVEASDVIIVGDDIEKVPQAIKISKKTHNVVMTNIIGSIAIKAIMLILLALPMININMICAVGADVGLLILAVLNSLRAGR